MENIQIEEIQKLVDNPHLLGHVIGKTKLIPLHSEWIKYCWDSNEPRAMQASRGTFKCLEPHTSVMMADGSNKEIRFVKTGDFVMGNDGTPRRVLSVHSGKDMMYKVAFRKGGGFVCNSRHDLVLDLSPSKRKSYKKYAEYLDGGKYIIETSDFVKMPKTMQRAFVHTKGVFEFPHVEVKLDPYILATWLGGGASTCTAITTPDSEIIEYWREYARRFNLHERVYKRITHRFSGAQGIGSKRKCNSLKVLFDKYNLIGNKHIPKEYMFNDREIRLQIIAGLIDTDGHKDVNGAYIVSSTNKEIAYSLAWICNSVGLHGKCTEHDGGCYYNGEWKNCHFYHVYINGDLSMIPLKVERKKPGKKYVDPESCNRYSADVTPIGRGDYVGIEIDGNHLFCLADFTVVHNSTSVDIVGIIRNFLLHPEERIAIIRKSFEDACSIVESVRQAMHNEHIKTLFSVVHGIIPKAIVAKHGKLRYNFKTSITPEGSLTAHGIDGSLTGMHYDRIICDDIITIKDRISKAERDKTSEMVREIATNIIDPGKGSIWIGTPWHREDAWNVINSFADIAMYPAPKYWFLGEDALRAKKESTTPYLFAANYLLELGRDEGLLFQNPKYFKHWDYSRACVGHLDAAFDGVDTNALTFMQPKSGYRIKGAKDLCAVGYCYEGNVKDWFDKIEKWYRQYKCAVIWVEDNADKGYTAAALRVRGLRVKTYHESQNKHLKITSCLYEYWRNIEWYEGTDPEYMNQILDYTEKNEPDDCPDSCASLIREAVIDKTPAKRALYQI